MDSFWDPQNYEQGILSEFNSTAVRSASASLNRLGIAKVLASNIELIWVTSRNLSTFYEMVAHGLEPYTLAPKPSAK